LKKEIKYMFTTIAGQNKKYKRNSVGSPLDDVFLIQKKQKDVKNDIYMVLRPDKDDRANKLFPDKQVVYLRYDKEQDLEIIKQFL